MHVERLLVAEVDVDAEVALRDRQLRAGRGAARYRRRPVSGAHGSRRVSTAKAWTPSSRSTPTRTWKASDGSSRLELDVDRDGLPRRELGARVAGAVVDDDVRQPRGLAGRP